MTRSRQDPHPDRPNVALRLDRASKDAVERIAAEQGTSAAALMEGFICAGLRTHGVDSEPPSAELRAARQVAVDVKNRVAVALGHIVEEIKQEIEDLEE